jgi:hypothetical protein
MPLTLSLHPLQPPLGLLDGIPTVRNLPSGPNSVAISAGRLENLNMAQTGCWPRFEADPGMDN